MKLWFPGIAVLAAIYLSTPALAAPVSVVCGKSVSSISKAEIVPFVTNSEIPQVVIPGAGAVVDVPAGTSRCVRVRFSAVANCPLACFLRAFSDETQLNPAWFSAPLRFSQDATNSGSAHAFEWAARIGPGRHVIRIKVNTGNTVQNASIGPWTSTIEVNE